MARQTDLAWAAGIMDGEGTITLSDNPGYNLGVRIMLSMTDQPTVYRFYGILRLGSFGNPTPETAKHKTKHHWGAYGAEGVSVCKILLPYLFTKKPHAELVIMFQRQCMLGRHAGPVSPEQIMLRTSALEQIRALNKRGK